MQTLHLKWVKKQNKQKMIDNNYKSYKYRQIARILAEAVSPIAVGTGESDILTDAPVAHDFNGLPNIPATSIAGVIRHALDIKDDNESIFGYHDKKGGKGSQVIFSDALFVGKDGKTIDGFSDIDWSDEFYRIYLNLPIRQHVRIDSNGTAEKGGKFDNEVVYKGTRFIFEIELYSEENMDKEFNEILSILYKDTLRFGSGIHNGYGKLKIIECQTATLNLSTPEDLQCYLSKSSCLATEWKRFKPLTTIFSQDNKMWTTYQLQLSPIDFFMFGSGLGDSEADNTPMTESIIQWTGTKPFVKKEQVLIPASAIKGALAHRTAYHYNRIQKLFVKNADNIEQEIDTEAKIGNDNPAVRAIFGYIQNGRTSHGNILISDIIQGEANTKVFYHNRIDVFTGGTIDGALFQEKNVWGRNCTYSLEIIVANNALAETSYRDAFERSLSDICNGLLPLGGAVNRGNGTFTGKIIKNGRTCIQ